MQVISDPCYIFWLTLHLKLQKMGKVCPNLNILSLICRETEILFQQITTFSTAACWCLSARTWKTDGMKQTKKTVCQMLHSNKNWLKNHSAKAIIKLS